MKTKQINTFPNALKACQNNDYETVAEYLNTRHPFVTAQLIAELIKKTATLADAEEYAKNVWKALFKLFQERNND